MTRIDFYILPSLGNSRERFACRVAEKAYQLGQQVYLHVPDEHSANRIDELLWTFRPGSFIPHTLASAGETDVPVVIGSEEPDASHHQVLINLAPSVPLFFSRFERVAEIVNSDEDEKVTGRDRFRFYRERGYPLESHHIENG